MTIPSSSFSEPAGRVPDKIIFPESVIFPAEKRPLGGRNCIPVVSPEDGEPTCLYWKKSVSAPRQMKLRFVAATDERFPHRIRVTNAVSGEHYGEIDALYACPGQVFELDLTAGQVGAAFREGLALSLKEGGAFWMLTEGPRTVPAQLPQLIADTGPASLERFLSLFCSAASLQPCDWMEVCVLDGLRDWKGLGRKDAEEALQLHLDTAFHPRTGRREDFRGRPCEGQPGGPETSGPFAVLALESPGHPALDCADRGFVNTHHAELDIVAGGHLVTESCYNVAYPMMAMGISRGDADLQRRALRQLRMCREYLSEPDDLHLRFDLTTRENTFTNWSRGVAWYALGFMRTLLLLSPEERPADLLEEMRRLAVWVETCQLPGGLWPCFLKETSVSPDTSGSAGIAAAIALGVQEGILDEKHLPAAEKAFAALMAHTSHDGWLRGVSQSNKKESHHMDIQRHPFRVTAPWGMGMLAQLASSLVRQSRLGASPENRL